MEANKSGRELKVLEIGSGTGVHFKCYRGMRLVKPLDNLPGLDVTSMIECFKCNIVLERVIGDAENMHLSPDKSFDVVISTSILCCVKRLSASLREMCRFLKR